MWINRKAPRTEFLRFDKRNSFSLQKRFQWKYTALLAGAVLFAVLASSLPLLYFFNQNYEIFSKLAYETAPELLEHLEREQTWLNGFLVIMGLSSIVFCIVFGWKSTARIIGPLIVLQNHIKAATRGNWSVREIKVRDNDEFRDLIASYNYFYHCLQKLTEDELKKIENLSVDHQNRNSYSTWRELLQDKSDRIGIETISSVSDSSPSLDSRRAS